MPGIFFLRFRLHDIYKTLWAYNIILSEVNGPRNEIMHVTWNSDLDLYFLISDLLVKKRVLVINRSIFV